MVIFFFFTDLWICHMHILGKKKEEKKGWHLKGWLLHKVQGHVQKIRSKYELRKYYVMSEAYIPINCSGSALVGPARTPILGHLQQELG